MRRSARNIHSCRFEKECSIVNKLVRSAVSFEPVRVFGQKRQKVRSPFREGIILKGCHVPCGVARCNRKISLFCAPGVSFSRGGAESGKDENDDNEI